MRDCSADRESDAPPRPRPPDGAAAEIRILEAAAARAALPGDGRPVVLDLGCGKGRFLRARAAARPEAWFIGIDRMISRLRRLAQRAERDGLRNLRLLHCDAYGALLFFLPPASISVCVIFFPDPWPKRRHHGRRLIAPPFLDALRRVLRPGGEVFLATDHAGYFECITTTFSRDAGFRPIPALVPPPEQQSDFERLFTSLDHPVYRCAYQRNQGAAATTAPPPPPARPSEPSCTGCHGTANNGD